MNKPFQNENDLKIKIKKVWPEVAKDLVEIRRALKQFIPRLESVQEKNGECIKTLFG